MMAGERAAFRATGIRAGLIFLLSLALALSGSAYAEEITFTSASPYQLGDLLKRAQPAYDVEISADLVYPEERKATMPALVFMHGSSGRLLRDQRFLEIARARGYVTFQLDSFRPRGASSTVGDQTNVTAAMMAIDVLRALKFLAERPEIDPNRIVIMGSSKGAIAALYASWTPIRNKVAGERDYAGYILLYPLCTAIEDGQTTSSPVHVYIGALDNWTPPAPCVAEVERMKQRGKAWSITLYQGAYHAFDAPITGIRELPHAYSMVGCRIALRADGYEVETGSGYLLTEAERRKALGACARKGAVRIGGSHAAEALYKDIGAFLEAR